MMFPDGKERESQDLYRSDKSSEGTETAFACTCAFRCLPLMYKGNELETKVGGDRADGIKMRFRQE